MVASRSESAVFDPACLQAHHARVRRVSNRPAPALAPAKDNLRDALDGVAE